MENRDDLTNSTAAATTRTKRSSNKESVMPRKQRDNGAITLVIFLDFFFDFNGASFVVNSTFLLFFSLKEKKKVL